MSIFRPTHADFYLLSPNPDVHVDTGNNATRGINVRYDKAKKNAVIQNYFILFYRYYLFVFFSTGFITVEKMCVCMRV